MKIIKRLAVFILISVVTLSCTVIGASAAVTEQQKKEITNELFEATWDAGLDVYYWQQTRSTVPIKDNPIAATTYMTIEAEIAVCNDDLLEKLYNDAISLEEFYDEYEFDYKVAKNINKYNNSLLDGYEFSYDDYRNGVWEMTLLDPYKTFYGYFREDENNFTFYDNDTNEVLGVYPRLLDFDYLDEGDGNGTGGSGNGVTGGNGGSDGTSSESSAPENDTRSHPAPPSTGILNTSSLNSDKTGSSEEDHAEYPDTDNPAVTPEIVSIVDALKSSESKYDRPVSQSPPKSSNNNTLIIILAVVAVICVAAFVVKKKNGKSGK